MGKIRNKLFLRKFLITRWLVNKMDDILDKDVRRMLAEYEAKLKKKPI